MTSDEEPTTDSEIVVDERLTQIERSLKRQDDNSRRARAVRVQKLDEALADIDPGVFGFVPGTPEIVFLRHEAQQAYLAGLGSSAVICAHSACERELAAWVQSLRGDTPKGWTYWGLGKLAPFAVGKGFIPNEIGDALLELNERRRYLYHLQDEESPQMTYIRAYEGLQHKDQWYGGMHNLLLRDGLEAIKTMTRLLAFLAPF